MPEESPPTLAGTAAVPTAGRQVERSQPRAVTLTHHVQRAKTHAPARVSALNRQFRTRKVSDPGQTRHATACGASGEAGIAAVSIAGRQADPSSARAATLTYRV